MLKPPTVVAQETGETEANFRMRNLKQANAFESDKQLFGQLFTNHPELMFLVLQLEILLNEHRSLQQQTLLAQALQTEALC